MLEKNAYLCLPLPSSLFAAPPLHAEQQQLSDEPKPEPEPEPEPAAGPLLAVAVDTGAPGAGGQRQSRVPAAHWQSHQLVSTIRLSGHIDARDTLQRQCRERALDIQGANAKYI